MTPSKITSGFMAAEISPFNRKIYTIDSFFAAFFAEKPILTPFNRICRQLTRLISICPAPIALRTGTVLELMLQSLERRVQSGGSIPVTKRRKGGRHF
jgi:hypothetical protein